MSYQAPSLVRLARLSPEQRARAGGWLFALAVQVLLALMALTLTPRIMLQKMADTVMHTFNIADPAEPTPEPAAEPEPVAEPERPAPSPPEAAPPAPAEPERPAPPLIELPAPVIDALDIEKIPQQPAKPARTMGPVMGPPDLRPRSTDSQRVEGSGPNGEPLYAASWYREPYEDELRGYLSTAIGPGWGMIACRTVPDFRVEDCFIVDEYPAGSRIANAVLQAAWQFRVRPPSLRGQPQIGEWVRIRIDYERHYRR